jgi:GAF domain-containing protein
LRGDRSWRIRSGVKDHLSIESVGFGDDQRLRDLLVRTCEATGMGFAAIARVTADRWIACQVEDRVAFGLRPGDELDIKKTICNDIRRVGEAIIFDDASTNPDWIRHPVPILYGFKSYASLPLYARDGSFFGTLCALDDERRAVTAAETVALLQGFAREAAAILSEKMDALSVLPDPA